MDIADATYAHTIITEQVVLEQTATAAKSEELIYVRTLRSVAIIVIVTEHIAFPLIYLYNNIAFADWWIANNFYLLGKIGSPLFTMVSGLLLLNPGKEQPIRLFFQKRFSKVLYPFLAWSALYIGWRIYFWQETLTLKDIAISVVQGPAYYHLWFIQMILGLYLATPILRVYIRHAPRQNLAYFLIIWAVTVSLLPITKRFFNFEIGIDVQVTTGFVGFFVLGYYLRDVTINVRQAGIILGIVTGSLLFTQLATHTLTVKNDGIYDNFFVLNDSPNLLIVATGLFLIFKSIDYDRLFQQLPIIQKIVLWLSSCSLGIYFVHVMLIEVLQSGKLGFVLDGSTLHPLISIPVTSFIVMTLSIWIVMILKLIPFVRNIVP